MTDKAKNGATSAFAKDKLFGQRIDEVFALGEHFQLLGGKIEDEPIDTELGKAELAKILVRRVDENDNPIGRPMIVGTLASSIVEKVKALTADDVPCLVEIRKVVSKRFKAEALVLQYVGADDLSEEAALAAAFGITIDPFEDLAEPKAEPAAA